jgi:ubiquinone/menaquinone biosynthesis C-methylase UbiE
LPEQVAQSFGGVAADYNRVRPDWPPAAVDRAAELLGLTSEADVVDLAAGTGKLTRLLAARFARVVAVEPDARMRAVLGAEGVEGTAERIPLPDRSVDAAFVGDAFHWFDAPVALAEIARVLRLRGGLALLWNQWWETDPPIPEAAAALLREPYERSGRAAAVRHYDWRAAFAGSPFETPREERLTGEAVVSSEELVALYRSTSSIAALEEAAWRPMRKRLSELLRGTYRLPLTIDLVWTRLA